MYKPLKDTRTNLETIVHKGYTITLWKQELKGDQGRVWTHGYTIIDYVGRSVDTDVTCGGMSTLDTCRTYALWLVDGGHAGRELARIGRYANRAGRKVR